MDPIYLHFAIPLGSSHSFTQIFFSRGSKSQLFSLLNPQDCQQLQTLLNQSLAPLLMIEAKSTLKVLLKHGIDVPRPLCLSTLHHLSTHEKAPLVNCKNSAEAQLLIHKLQFQLTKELNYIEKNGLQKIARLESLVCRPFAAMEFHGLPINRQQWQQLIEQAKVELRQQEEAGQAPSAKLTKLVSTYGDNFLNHINSQSGRLHGTFEPLGTATGRSSCHSPNLQNLPASADFHQCIAAPLGKSLVCADYATCELRILAALSEEELFCDAFAQDIDLHAQVASQLFGVKVSKSENTHLRQQAKTINFGIIYGMGASALAKQLNLSLKEAQEMLKHYFIKYPKIKNYLDHSVKTAKEKGFAQTIWGRKLIFKNHFGEESTEDISRLARNMPIQGSAADMMKLALITIQERLQREFSQAFLVNMIHDEVLVECNSDDAESVAQLVKHEMEEAERVIIPQVKAQAEVHFGPTWSK